MKKKFIISIMLLTTIATGNITKINAYAEVNTTVSQNLNIEDKSSDLSFEDKSKNIAKSILETYNISGIQYAVMYNNEFILSDSVGVANKEDNTEIDENTMFGIGSISKMFVTASIMKLVDEGKIDIDKPVTEYIPDFKMKDDRYKKITVRMLLNHSAGFMGTDYSNSFLFNDNDSSEYDNLLDTLSEQRLKYEPGELSVYCNDGFSLAQLIIEKVSGIDFTSYIHENFTEELGMDYTKTPQDGNYEDELCEIYNNKEKLPVESVNIIGAGGIYSTAEDLCKFAQVFNNDEILSEKSRNDTIQNEADKGINIDGNEGTLQYGLGWDNVKIFDLSKYNIQGVVKGGDTYNYHGSLIDIPKYNLTVAVLSSGGTSSADEMIGTSIAVQALKDKGIIKEILPNKEFEKVERRSVTQSEKNKSGLYMMNEGLVEIKISDNGELQMFVPGNTQSINQKFYYGSDGYYTSEDNTQKCRLVTESNGITYLQGKAYQTIPGISDLSQSVVDYYQAQKVENNSLPEDVKKAWNERIGVDYLLVNEKYTSQLYLKNLAITQINYGDDTMGYVDSRKIIDANNAESILRIPGIVSRDMTDFNFYKRNSKEYVKSGSFVYISSKDIDSINETTSSVTIDKKSECTKWFKVDNIKNKEMTAEIEGNGSFAVYDENKQCVYYSLENENSTVTLEDGYYVVFSGEKNIEFKLSYK